MFRVWKRILPRSSSVPEFYPVLIASRKSVCKLGWAQCDRSYEDYRS